MACSRLLMFLDHVRGTQDYMYMSDQVIKLEWETKRNETRNGKPHPTMKGQLLLCNLGSLVWVWLLSWLSLFLPLTSLPPSLQPYSRTHCISHTNSRLYCTIENLVYTRWPWLVPSQHPGTYWEATACILETAKYRTIPSTGISASGPAVDTLYQC